MNLIFFITILYAGFIGGFAYGKTTDKKNKSEKQSHASSKASFHSPLVRYK